MALVIKKASSKVSGYQEVLTMRSFSNPDQVYLVDRKDKVCSCMQFAKEGKCKHLDSVGAYIVKPWNAPLYPTFSQALSALVKTIRLRKVDEAIYWLLYLNNCKQDGGRFRVARRLLIGSAEDGHSISVMERVSRNFPHLCDLNTHVIELAAEVVRICTVPNWWDSATNGRDYIRAGMTANRLAWLYSEGGDSIDMQLKGLEDGVKESNPIKAMTSLEKMVKDNTMSRTNIAKYLLLLSDKFDNDAARRLVNIHLTHRSALSGDCNFIGQAVWWLAGGNSPLLNGIGVVTAGEVKALLSTQWAKLAKPDPIPVWCCDGIHCSGIDRRFAGIWHDMMAVCNVFDKFGDMPTSREWLPDYFSLDGLKYE